MSVAKDTHRIPPRRCGSTLPFEIIVRAEPCSVCGAGRWPRCERCESTGMEVVIVEQTLEVAE